MMSPDPLRVNYQPLDAEDGDGMALWQPMLGLHAQGETVEAARWEIVVAAAEAGNDGVFRLVFPAVAD
jgi:predicted RNase H-like HicB family nuclease